MNNILLIAKREYLSRVKKKSFLIMTFLSPLLISVFYGLVIYFTVNSDIAESEKKIAIVDHINLLKNDLEDTKTIKFQYLNDYAEAETLLKNNFIYALLLVEPKDSITKSDNFVFTLKTNDKPSLNTVTVLESKISNALKNNYLEGLGVDKKLIDEINSKNVVINTVKISGNSESETSSGLATIIGFIGGFIIYFFIFLYGVQVMRGVIDEKVSRVVEVIISTIKPHQLMAGKIMGIAFVGITQFVAWMLLLFLFISFGSNIIYQFLQIDVAQLTQTATTDSASAQKVSKVLNTLFEFDIIGYLLVFLFYFISGYLFYGALFAAIGSAVDNETDTQQFMLPVTLPLIFSILLSQSIVMHSPNSNASFWLSVIPFTSPVVMLIRYPFEVPIWQLITSIISMIAGIIFNVWLASKIYRIGILSYGKKPSYKEIWKWLFIKN